MKKLSLLLLSGGLVFALGSCDSLEKTDKVRSEIVTATNGDTLVYEMYLTGLKKFRYEFNVVNNRDTTSVFETSFEDSKGNEAMMEIEPINGGLRITLDKPVDDQTKTVNGVIYELKGTEVAE